MFGFGFSPMSRSLAGAGGGVAVVSAVSDAYFEHVGGGGRVVVTVDNSATASAIKSVGGAQSTTWTSFQIDDATHVSGIPSAHNAGVCDVVVVNDAGDSTGGEGLIEYINIAQWSACVLRLANASLSAGTLASWTDTSPAANHTTAYASPPVAVDAQYGGMLSVGFDGIAQFLRTLNNVTLSAGMTLIMVMRGTSGATNCTVYGRYTPSNYLNYLTARARSDGFWYAHTGYGSIREIPSDWGITATPFTMRACFDHQAGVPFGNHTHSLFQNGVQVSTPTYSTGGTPPPNTFAQRMNFMAWVQTPAEAGSSFLAGTVADITLFSRLLSASEITKIESAHRQRFRHY